MKKKHKLFIFITRRKTKKKLGQTEYKTGNVVKREASIRKIARYDGDVDKVQDEDGDESAPGRENEKRERNVCEKPLLRWARGKRGPS